MWPGEADGCGVRRAQAQKQSRVEETARMRREVQTELTEKTLRAQVGLRA